MHLQKRPISLDTATIGVRCRSRLCCVCFSCAGENICADAYLAFAFRNAIHDVRSGRLQQHVVFLQIEFNVCYLNG